MSIASDDIFLAEIDVNVAGTETTIYATGDSDARTADGNVYEPRLKSPFVGLARAMFPPSATRGQAPQGVGEIELRNDDGFYDSLKRGAFAGRRVVVRRGQVSNLGSYPSLFSTVLHGVMSAPDWTPESSHAPTGALRIQVRDARKYASVAFQPNVYAGDNVDGEGLEGTADDLKGKTKPECFGRVFNVPLVLVNAGKNIYELASNEIEIVTDVRDAGYSIGGLPASLSSVAHGLDSGDTGFTCMADNGTRIVIAGWRSSTTPFVAYSDDDGETWTAVGNPFSDLTSSNVAGLDFNGSVFVATGNHYSDIATSTDGVTWTARTSALASGGDMGKCRWAAFASLFVRVGGSSQIETSPTGTTWTSRTAGTATILTDLAIGDDAIVVVGQSGTVLRSSDGITWTAVSYFGGFTNFLSAAYRRRTFYIGGFDASTNGQLYSSTDNGEHWVLRPAATAPGGGGGASPIVSLTANETGIVATGFSGQAICSADGGASWAASKYASTMLLRFAHRFGGRWIVGGNSSPSGEIAVSDPSVVYANTTDLQDDTLAPPHGSYGVCLTASGSYVRLGSPASGQITADFVAL